MISEAVPHPIKGFEEARIPFLYDGKPTEIHIISEKQEQYKLFKACVEQDGKLEKIASIQFHRFHITKQGLYKSSAYKREVIQHLYFYDDENKPTRMRVELLEEPRGDKYKHIDISAVLIQAVTEYGYSKGCEGRVDLTASRSSHVFFYNLGMRTYDESTNTRIMHLASQSTRPDTSSLRPVTMYMPREGRASWKEKVVRSPIFKSK